MQSPQPNTHAPTHPREIPDTRRENRQTLSTLTGGQSYTDQHKPTWPHTPRRPFAVTPTRCQAHTQRHTMTTPTTHSHTVPVGPLLVLPCQLGVTPGRVRPMLPAALSCAKGWPEPADGPLGARVWTRVHLWVPRSRGPKYRQRPRGPARGMEPRGAARSPRERDAARAQLLRGAARRGPSGKDHLPSPSNPGNHQVWTPCTPRRCRGPRPTSVRPAAALTDVDDGVGPHRHALAYPGEKPQRQRFHVPRARGSSARARGEAEGSAERGGARPGAVPGRSPGEPSPPERLPPRARPCARRPP